MPTPFISRADLGDYLGRDVSSDEGALIAVDSACEVVRTLTEQDFNPVNGDTVVLDGTGTDTLLLPQVPVSGAGTVVVNGGTLDGTLDYTVTEDGHLIRTAGTAALSTWAHSVGPSAYWPEGRQNITVTYDHGYLAGTATDVPADVRMVALMIANRLVTQGGASAETIGQVTKRYAVAATDLTNGERAILRKYKRSQ